MRFSPGAHIVVNELTERQHAVAWLVGQGLSNRQIATRCGISVSAVQGHINAILHKLVLHDRRQLVVWVMSGGRGPRAKE